MNSKMSAADRAKVEELIRIRQRNNDYAWMLCDYLDQNPRLITKELMEESNPGGLLPDEAIYTALLTGFCGLNPEENPDDRILLNDYFRQSVVKLDAKTYAEDPYYKNIRIPNARFGRWELKYEHYKAYEAFVCDEMILKPDFREIQRIGFFDSDFSYPAVMEDGHEWMAIKPNETATITFAVNAAHGRVATFGLGMGYYPYLVHLKPDVESITIIERSADVIELFKTHILPQFDMPEKVRIVQADAFEYAAKQMPAERFDYAFADTWRDVSDGLPMYLRMKKLERLNPATEFSYWVEESLLSGYRWQMFDTVIDNAKTYDEVCQCLSDEGLRRFAAIDLKVEK
ncbi:MAG: hypothetical protein IKZ99_05615 [Salinivirgaceae bacterium]|nr:hypothetical protein [Salinivirgaceae bacterium]